jgi:hypothetical protein
MLGVVTVPNAAAIKYGPTLMFASLARRRISADSSAVQRRAKPSLLVLIDTPESIAERINPD